jgi:hypothetical protein
MRPARVSSAPGFSAAQVYPQPTASQKAPSKIRFEFRLFMAHPKLSFLLKSDNLRDHL